jgi:hypothetical protein
LDFQFTLTIGFDDILPFQAFTLYPNRALGDLSLVVRLSPNALVWCSVDPEFLY